MTTLMSLDHAVFRAINAWQGNALLDAVFVYGTELGTVWFGGSLALLAYMIRARGRVPSWSRFAALAALATLTAAVSTGVKYLVYRPRPMLTLSDVRVLGPELGLYSFPSGHTVLAFSILGILAVIDRPLARVWLPLAVFTALSRVYLGVHFPSDVVCGAALGFFGVFPLAKRVWIERT